MTKTNELISAIYAATLVPEDFNRKFDDLDNLLFEEGQAPGVLEPSTLPHIDNARSIQDRLGRTPSLEQQIETILEAVPNPSYLITQRGTVAAANAMAIARDVRTPARLEDFIDDESTRRRVSEFLSRDKTGRLLAIAGLERDGGGEPTSILLKRVDPGLLPAGAEQLFLVSIVDLGFDDDAVALFRDAFELTEAESQVAVLLASGMRLPDIAAERNVSIDTVRTQIKLIKNKTGVADIPALVRLMYGFNAGALAPTNARQMPASRRRAGPLRIMHRVKLRDGRHLEYLEQGAADGEVVLLFHNVPYGIELPAAANVSAEACNLRFIAPLRPGFGGSDMVADRGDELVTRVAEDAAELLEQLGIRRATAVSHSTSAPYALRFARLYPRLVTRLVGVSQPPAWKDEWLPKMPQRQRFMLRLVKQAPQLLPVVAWAMRAVMESNRANDFVRYNCDDGAADSRAAQNQETVDLIARGSVDAIRAGFDGLIAAMENIVRDFTEEARATPHKFHMIHGADDKIIDPAHTMTFARDVPGTTVEMVEGAGQLLFYSHWERMLDAIAPERVSLTWDYGGIFGEDRAECAGCRCASGDG